MKVLITTMGTGDYTKFFPGFYESLNNFLPTEQKDLVYLTDSVINFQKENNVGINQKYIKHKPWPINMILKPHYWLDSIEGNYDYVFWFDVKKRFIQEVDSKIFLTDKLIRCHQLNWELENKNHYAFTLNKPLSDKNLAYINGDYEYFHANGMGGPTSLVKDMCNIIIEWTNIDLMHNRIPIWHDESYYNRYCHDYNELFITLPREYNMTKETEEKLNIKAKISYIDDDEIQDNKDKLYNLERKWKSV